MRFAHRVGTAVRFILKTKGLVGLMVTIGIRGGDFFKSKSQPFHSKFSILYKKTGQKGLQNIHCGHMFKLLLLAHDQTVSKEKRNNSGLLLTVTDRSKKKFA